MQRFFIIQVRTSSPRIIKKEQPVSEKTEPLKKEPEKKGQDDKYDFSWLDDIEPLHLRKEKPAEINAGDIILGRILLIKIDRLTGKSYYLSPVSFKWERIK